MIALISERGGPGGGVEYYNVVLAGVGGTEQGDG